MLKLVLLLFLTVGVYGHGRFMKPVSRSSIWRVPEFAEFDPPKNLEDNQLYCGGVHQLDDPGVDCGVCGDSLGEAVPRANEINGTMYRGIKTGRYTSGETIDVEVEITSSKLGNMEWRLCTSPENESQECFDENVLQLASGGTKLPVDRGYGMYSTQILLPDGVVCEHCVIQWNYRTGNSWACNPDGECCLGCGPQETFRGCSDVSIM